MSKQLLNVPMSRIFYVEDDLGLAHVVSRWITKQGHTVTHVDSVALAREYLLTAVYDLIVLDWELPDGCGTDLLLQHRRGGATTPVLMLTQRSKIEDKLEGFTAGADDYLTKPFDGREFMMRVQALLKRAPIVVSSNPTFMDLILQVDSHTVARGSKVIQLSKRESSLLEFLMRRPEQVIPSEVLINNFWANDDEAGSVEALTTCIGRLRKKLGCQGKQNNFIRNVHGRGYALLPPDKEV